MDEKIVEHLKLLNKYLGVIVFKGPGMTTPDYVWAHRHSMQNRDKIQWFLPNTATRSSLGKKGQAGS